MGTIVGSIRNIGIFMIAAQAVMHFAPGKQYEKYIKLIAGVMVLAQFINPFIHIEEDFESEWAAGVEQMQQQLDGQRSDAVSGDVPGVTGVWNDALQQIEGELQSRLNQMLENDVCRVAEVQIRLEETPDAGGENCGWTVGHIRIVLEKKGEVPEKKGGESVVEPVRIEEISITSTDRQQEIGTEEAGYKSLFAKTLGIEEDRVEVICRGGW